MTREEAIERISDYMEVQKIGEYPHIKLAVALNMAISALRAQQTPTKLDRSQWKECVVCNRCGEGGSNELLCGGVKEKYCPFCGRPLTEEARAELERRINGGTADI